MLSSAAHNTAVLRPEPGQEPLCPNREPMTGGFCPPLCKAVLPFRNSLSGVQMAVQPLVYSCFSGIQRTISLSVLYRTPVLQESILQKAWGSDQFFVVHTDVPRGQCRWITSGTRPPPTNPETAAFPTTLFSYHQLSVLCCRNALMLDLDKSSSGDQYCEGLYSQCRPSFSFPYTPLKTGQSNVLTVVGPGKEALFWSKVLY